MGSDAPLLERLASLPPVTVSVILEILTRPGEAGRDPLLAGLVGVDEDGDPALHPLAANVLQQLDKRPDATCYAALIEALTGVWNAAVRGAVVARLRRQGLPPDDLLLRLQSLSPTLGFQSDDRQWARAWLADPTAQDAGLVQHCLVRLLLAVRGLAEARARTLLEGPAADPGGARPAGTSDDGPPEEE